MKFKKQYTARTRHSHGAITQRTNTKPPRAQSRYFHCIKTLKVIKFFENFFQFLKKMGFFGFNSAGTHSKLRKTVSLESAILQSKAKKLKHSLEVITQTLKNKIKTKKSKNSREIVMMEIPNQNL